MKKSLQKIKCELKEGMTTKKTGWVATTNGPKRIRINPWFFKERGCILQSVYLYNGDKNESRKVIPFLISKTKAECEKQCKSPMLFESWEDFAICGI